MSWLSDLEQEQATQTAQGVGKSYLDAIPPWIKWLGGATFVVFIAAKVKEIVT